MPGTKAGGIKASITNRDRHGENFYATIGAKGGKASSTGGFAAKIPCDCKLITGDHLKRQCAGKKGGTVSRRT